MVNIFHFLNPCCQGKSAASTSNLLFLCLHCCSLHILSEWPMDRPLLTALRCFADVVRKGTPEAPITVARADLGHRPTSRHHCFKVTATLETFTPVRRNASPKPVHFSFSCGGILESKRKSGISPTTNVSPYILMRLAGNLITLWLGRFSRKEERDGL